MGNMFIFSATSVIRYYVCMICPFSHIPCRKVLPAGNRNSWWLEYAGNVTMVMNKAEEIFSGKEISRKIRRIFTRLMILLVRLYQYVISPLLPGSCRFVPSCSEYAIQAIRTRGIFAGLFLSARRVLRCNPWGGHGFDPVPPRGTPLVRWKIKELK